VTIIYVYISVNVTFINAYILENDICNIILPYNMGTNVVYIKM
jgi:hypothetical protein